MLDMLQVGVITTTHGLKGEVKVFLTSDDPKRFDTLDEVILVEGAGSRPLSIEHVKYFKGRPILKFKGLDRIEDVEHLHTVATDGMTHQMREFVEALDDESFEIWKQYCLHTCERKDLQGFSNHMLWIGRKIGFLQ